MPELSAAPRLWQACWQQQKRMSKGPPPLRSADECWDCESCTSACLTLGRLMASQAQHSCQALWPSSST